MELHHRTASDPDLNMKQLFRSDALAAQHHTSLDFEKAAHCGGIPLGRLPFPIMAGEPTRRCSQFECFKI
jgi:hypothetical protein